MGFGGADIPVTKPVQAARTAEPVKQISEQAKKNKALAASMLTKGWNEPILGKKGLLGVSGRDKEL